MLIETISTNGPINTNHEHFPSLRTLFNSIKFDWIIFIFNAENILLAILCNNTSSLWCLCGKKYQYWESRRYLKEKKEEFINFNNVDWNISVVQTFFVSVCFFNDIGSKYNGWVSYLLKSWNWWTTNFIFYPRAVSLLFWYPV